MPERRIGTRWQRRPSVWTWARTNWDVLRHPGTTFRFLRIEAQWWRPLLVANVLLAAFLLVEPWTGTFLGDPLRNVRAFENPRVMALYAISLAARTFVVGVILFGLTWIEARGVRFIAAKRGWRIGSAAAWQICAHASIGWVVMAVLPVLTLATLFTASSFFGAAWSSWAGRTFNLSPYVNRVVSAGELVSLAITALVYVGGLLVFELLVYVGVRRCRYANGPDAGAGGTSA